MPAVLSGSRDTRTAVKGRPAELDVHHQKESWLNFLDWEGNGEGRWILLCKSHASHSLMSARGMEMVVVVVHRFTIKVTLGKSPARTVHPRDEAAIVKHRLTQLVPVSISAYDIYLISSIWPLNEQTIDFTRFNFYFLKRPARHLTFAINTMIEIINKTKKHKRESHFLSDS